MRFDRNPLRRATDRAETVVLLLLVVLFLAGAPLSALAAGAGLHSVAQRTELAQHASRYQVTAKIVAVTGAPTSGNLTTQVRAQWTAPDGTLIKKDMPVSIGYTPGDTLQVFTTRDGQLTTRPMAEAQVRALTNLGRVAGVAVFGLFVLLVSAVARWWLNRRRMAAWDADWRATGPRWTTRT